MENRVNFIAYAENVPEDVNNLQSYVSDSLDHIVVDTLVQGSKFSGFLTAKSGPAQVVVTAGRLYRNGVVYARATPTTFDFTTQLPVAAKKKVLITAWGTEVDTGATPRNVLIAAQSTPQNPVYQPQILEITHSRIVNLGTSVGAEAPDPAAPVIDAALLLLATVVLSPTGVESVTVASENEVGNLEDLSDRVTDIETWEAVAAPMIDIAATYVGQTSITTLGTITTGAWNGTAIGVAYGGTGVMTLTGLVKGNGTSAFTAAVAGTDYLSPSSTIDGGTF